MIPLRQTLSEMGWSQPKTPLQTDNLAAVGVTKNTIVPRCTKLIDMHFYWLLWRKYQDQFQYYWAPGASNLVKYSTKHHPPMYQGSLQPTHAGIKVG